MNAVVDMTAKRTSGSIEIAASPEELFALLVDPARHAEFDGSGMVQSSSGSSGNLELGSRFGMWMKLGPLPYRITSKVVEFVENRLIAWQHFGKHRWRYELEPTEIGTTKVTETFDWSTSRSRTTIESAGYPERHVDSINGTLERLKALVEGTPTE